MPQTSRQIRDLGLNKTPKTRRRYNVIAKGFEAHQQTVAAHTQRIASLEEELARLKRGKKRKAVPNPNKRFMTLGETLAGKESIPEGATRYTPIGVEFISSSEQESASEAGSVIEVASSHFTSLCFTSLHFILLEVDGLHFPFSHTILVSRRGGGIEPNP
ncbi:hypothetical protein FPOA_13540 [Fusarium poae]|uniref:Uncharacterized protein n=1 Tax=Fusarium poae TaxID=36050 RepID=A0A1B8A5B7_FUSPO|nr:hypothetical protein FPOA_13540 [Fusarium poae]